jgi:hypothetical protein
MLAKLARVFMGKLEEQLQAAVKIKPFSWLHFIDDIDMQWCHGKEALKDFLLQGQCFSQNYNVHHRRIKRTACFS